MSSLNLNRVLIGGKLCAEPETRQTQSGTAVATIRVAVNRKISKSDSGGTPQQTADFFNVVAWQKAAELVSQYFHKGSSILVEGRLQERQWTDKDGQKRYSTEIVAENVYFVDSKSESLQPSAQPAYTASKSETANFVDISSDDPLPF